MTLSRRRVPESASVYPQTGRDALCGRRARCSRGRQSIVTDKTTTKVSGAGARRNLLKAATGAAALGLIPVRATAQADPRSMDATSGRTSPGTPAVSTVRRSPHPRREMEAASASRGATPERTPYQTSAPTTSVSSTTGTTSVSRSSCESRLRFTSVSAKTTVPISALRSWSPSTIRTRWCRASCR